MDLDKNSLQENMGSLQKNIEGLNRKEKELTQTMIEKEADLAQQIKTQVRRYHGER